MIKTSLIALATVAAVSLAAFPASAEGLFGNGEQDLAKASVVAELQRDGINATSVEEWNGYIRAFVTLEDGRQVQRFFDAGHAAARSDRRPRGDRPRALATFGAADSVAAAPTNPKTYRPFVSTNRRRADSM